MKRKDKNREKGSITVFAALTLLLIAEFLFVLIEGCRHIELGKAADMNTDAVTESMLAEYCRPMWEEYHLLTNDLGCGGREDGIESWTSYMTALTASNYAEGLLRMALQSVDYSSYTLLTDGKGKSYIHTVSAYMKHNLLYEGAQKVYSSYEALENLKKNGKFDFGAITDAIKSIDNAGSSGKTTPIPASGEPPIKGELPSKGEASSREEAPPISVEDRKKAEKGQSILKSVKEAYTSGVLKLVLPESTGVSEGTMAVEQLVSHRTLAEGLAPEVEEISWLDKVMLQQYLIGYLSDYSQKPESERALQYELEYLMGGKSTDRENLAVVAEELLAIREAANMLYLSTDPQKKAEVLAMAKLIAGVSMNPLIVGATKVGLTAAWAFAESILDVRRLMAGGKVPLTKSDRTWKSSLEKIPEILIGHAAGGGSGEEGGLDYREYLGVMLFTKSSEKLAMRAMDLQEMRIRKLEHYEDFAMDRCICSVKCRLTYSFEPLLLPISGTIEREAEASYLSSGS